jgi:hypothetical protein
VGITLDGNQVGLLAGGGLILLGAVASSGILREQGPLQETATGPAPKEMRTTPESNPSSDVRRS